MDGEINVILYGNPEIVEFLCNGINKMKNIQIKGITNNPSELIQLLKENKYSIIVFEGKDSSDYNDDFISIVANEDYHSIVICTDIRNGFLMLKKGANEMVNLRERDLQSNCEGFFNYLNIKVKTLYNEYFKPTTRILKNDFGDYYDKVIAIGSSTGGTEIICQILKSLPEKTPPILIVQHMPPVFTRLFAERLNSTCKITVWEGKNGDHLKSGLALIAPGDFQMKVVKKDEKVIISCDETEKVNNHCPSVDILFESVANIFMERAIGIILTGMGSDGAQGLLKMRNAGAYTLGQDKESSIVYGMPKVAFEINAVQEQLNTKDIIKTILNNI